MGTTGSTSEDASATYEVHLHGKPPETLVARFAPSDMGRTSTQTVLMRRVSSQDELAGLLERVLAMGLVLDEVRELRVASSAPGPARPSSRRRGVHRAYEVRVHGVLDPSLLRFLGWQHRHLPEFTALSVEGTPEHVHEFLGACCRLGLGLEQVRRVTPVTEAREPATTP
jgi:hypothetical protein